MDMKDFLQQEKLIDRHIARNNTDEAVELLYSLIVQYARAKKFTSHKLARSTYAIYEEIANQ